MELDAIVGRLYIQAEMFRQDIAKLTDIFRQLKDGSLTLERLIVLEDGRIAVLPLGAEMVND